MWEGEDGGKKGKKCWREAMGCVEEEGKNELGEEGWWG